MGYHSERIWIGIVLVVIGMSGILFYETVTGGNAQGGLTGAVAAEGPFGSVDLNPFAGYDHLNKAQFSYDGTGYILYVSLRGEIPAPYLCVCGERCPRYSDCRRKLGNPLPAEVCNDNLNFDEDEDMKTNCLDLSDCYRKTNICLGEQSDVLLTAPLNIGDGSGTIKHWKMNNIFVDYVTGNDACLREARGSCVAIEKYVISGGVARWERTNVGCSALLTGFDLSKIHRALCEVQVAVAAGAGAVGGGVLAQ